MNYFEMYKAVWDFHKKFIGGVKDDDKFWETVVDESTAISKKYGECKFINSLLLSEIEEFERICKEVRANANTRV